MYGQLITQSLYEIISSMMNFTLSFLSLSPPLFHFHFNLFTFSNSVLLSSWPSLQGTFFFQNSLLSSRKNAQILFYLLSFLVWIKQTLILSYPLNWSRCRVNKKEKMKWGWWLETRSTSSWDLTLLLLLLLFLRITVWLWLLQ